MLIVIILNVAQLKEHFRHVRYMALFTFNQWPTEIDYQYFLVEHCEVALTFVLI